MSELDHADDLLQRMAKAFASGQVTAANLRTTAMLYAAERLDADGNSAAANALTKFVYSEAPR